MEMEIIMACKISQTQKHISYHMQNVDFFKKAMKVEGR
jgi:hypothetical protein